MPTRKYAPKRKLRRTKGRRTKRRYGRKRGGMFGLTNPFSSTPSETETECEKKCKAEAEADAEANASELGQAGQPSPEDTPVAIDIANEQSGPTGEKAVGGNGMNGGRRRRRRRRSSKKRSSKKSRKSRKTKRRQRGGCIGHAFQPSIVNPPNSALANPAPFARYTTGP